MPLPVDISFHDVPHSKAVEDAVTRQANRLDHICGRIMRCRVSLTMGARHQHQGRPFVAQVGVTMPHQAYLSSKASDEDLYVAVREAFAHVERMVVEATQKRQSHTDQHTDQAEAS